MSRGGTENFLVVTKEGYCVRYAPALTLLLREAGPARYVEGYVASDFRRNYAEDMVGRYIANVRDYNAHAWVEVWYDGIGWVQYEATPVYYNDMYVKETGEGSGGVVRPWDPEEEYTEEEMLLEELRVRVDLAAMQIDSMRGDIAMLFDNQDIKRTLDNLEGLLSIYRKNQKTLSDYYAENKDSAEYDQADFLRAQFLCRVFQHKYYRSAQLPAGADRQPQVAQQADMGGDNAGASRAWHNDCRNSHLHTGKKAEQARGGRAHCQR